MNNQIHNKVLLPVKYRESQKFNAWVECFFDKANRKTYGNATQCALRVYNTKSYQNASSIGHQNYRKLQNLSVAILDDEGFGFADLMKIGLKKMMEGEYDDWDRFMQRLGYFDKKTETPQTQVNIQNVINSLGEE